MGVVVLETVGVLVTNALATDVLVTDALVTDALATDALVTDALVTDVLVADVLVAEDNAIFVLEVVVGTSGAAVTNTECSASINAGRSTWCVCRLTSSCTLCV
ncbi:hypothetical protein MHBO_003575 [Bonamia ostreae]|uniref:Secreted protein n=1 Tax=Bonamia ostreae TaxID=126728 RepID=A0ABV2ARR6_9EUKA